MIARNKTIEILGWIGVIEILTAYYLSTNIITNREAQANLFLIATLLNITGSILMIIKTLPTRNIQGVFLNVIWIIFAITGIMFR